MQQQQASANQSVQYRNYNLGMLIALFSVFVIGFLFLILSGVFSTSAADTSSGDNILFQIGILVLIGESIAIMILDWRGSITLRGASKGYVFHKGKQVSTTPTFVILYVIMPYIMLPIYLVRTSLNYRSMKQVEAQQQKHKIATLEAELGILPPTDGTCRVCKKPLIVGAEFCQYCGATAIEHPKICPACATTASPDAKWCPKCRTALT